MAYSNKDKKKMVDCLERCDFHKSNAVLLFCKECDKKINRATLYRWINSDEYFKELFNERLDKELNDAEQSHKYLRDGLSIKDDNGEIIAWQEKPDRQAIEFFLKVRGRDRGWVEKTEQKIEIEIEKPLIIHHKGKELDL